MAENGLSTVPGPVTSRAELGPAISVLPALFRIEGSSALSGRRSSTELLSSSSAPSEFATSSTAFASSVQLPERGAFSRPFSRGGGEAGPAEGGGEGGSEVKLWGTCMGLGVWEWRSVSMCWAKHKFYSSTETLET